MSEVIPDVLLTKEPRTQTWRAALDNTRFLL